jgi:hypothetical protein
VVTHSIQLLTCAQFGCPGCDYRHFHRTSDDSYLTDVPGEGMFTRAQLATLGRAALATGAMDDAEGVPEPGHEQDPEPGLEQDPEPGLEQDEG